MKQVIEIPYDLRNDQNKEEERDKFLEPWINRFDGEMFYFSSFCENELIYSNDDGTWRVHVYMPIYDDYYYSNMPIKELLITYAERISLVEYEYEGKLNDC